MARKLAKRKKGPARKSTRGAVKKTAKKAARKPVRKSAKKTARKAAPRKAARPKAKPRTTAKSKPSSKPKRSAAPKITVAKKAAPATPAKPARHAPSLERNRRRLPEFEDNIPTPPSSLDMDRTPTAAQSGRRASMAARAQHNETSPELTGGDVDADWEDAYAVGDEAPGGDNPTPDQDRVDDIGRALGVEYQDNEELKGGDKISGRDRHRWELDPASAEDYNDHDPEE